MTMADYIEQMRRLVPMTPGAQQYQPLQAPMGPAPQAPQPGIMPEGLSLETNMQMKRRLQDIKPQMRHDPLSPFWLQYNTEF